MSRNGGEKCAMRGSSRGYVCGWEPGVAGRPQPMRLSPRVHSAAVEPEPSRGKMVRTHCGDDSARLPLSRPISPIGGGGHTPTPAPADPADPAERARAIRLRLQHLRWSPLHSTVLEATCLVLEATSPTSEGPTSIMARGLVVPAEAVVQVCAHRIYLRSHRLDPPEAASETETVTAVAATEESLAAEAAALAALLGTDEITARMRSPRYGHSDQPPLHEVFVAAGDRLVDGEVQASSRYCESGGAEGGQGGR